MTDPLQDWLVTARTALRLPDEIDVDRLLAVAREVAHGVARPAAPVTTYLLGLAVARGANLADAADALLVALPKEAE